MTKSLLLLAACLGLGQTLPAQNWDDYRWKNRLILIFFPELEAQTAYRQQAILLAAQPGLDERDLKVFLLPANEHASSRKRFGIAADEFTLILVGKDGGEKYRTNALTEARVFFGQIDAMPMRQAEMRSRP